MEYCSKKAIEIWDKHCKGKAVKLGENFIDHLSIHDVLKIIDIALEQGANDIIYDVEEMYCKRNIKSCVFFDNGKCKNQPSECRDQTKIKS